MEQNESILEDFVDILYEFYRQTDDLINGLSIDVTRKDYIDTSGNSDLPEKIEALQREKDLKAHLAFMSIRMNAARMMSQMLNECVYAENAVIQVISLEGEYGKGSVARAHGSAKNHLELLRLVSKIHIEHNKKRSE